MRDLFWYEIKGRHHTHVALDRPRRSGELVKLQDAAGCVIQRNTGGRWWAFSSRGQPIGFAFELDRAMAYVTTFVTAKHDYTRRFTRGAR